MSLHECVLQALLIALPGAVLALVNLRGRR
jgi:hypothetical protein